ncbi:MAG TPA: selenium-dependent molybdenum cofactor biosynthesis protein YqeB [Desulfomonilaceae bacterium]|nr:selenium-dependent molybdenum cofactor biosynthesis protein YqeB [Desulfomonilaceae bacterium]
MPQRLSDLKIIIRGAGEMATGTAWRLVRAGFHKLIMTEIDFPLAVRRTVSFCEALYEGTSMVEGVQAVRIASPDQVVQLWREGIVPVLIDSSNTAKDIFKPDVLIDAILAKRNLGTALLDAPLVIGLGPGFYAGTDVHYVVETNRGHDLGRLILEGSAVPDTGVPGDIGGQTLRRVLRSPRDGRFDSDFSIGTLVSEGQVVGQVDGQPVATEIAGVLRGLIRPGLIVTRGLKIGDVDPRANLSYCYTISEKARAIAGTVLEAILMRYNQPQREGM